MFLGQIFGWSPVFLADAGRKLIFGGKTLAGATDEMGFRLDLARPLAIKAIFGLGRPLSRPSFRAAKKFLGVNWFLRRIFGGNLASPAKFWPKPGYSKANFCR
jgi:hypothetical protein